MSRAVGGRYPEIVLRTTLLALSRNAALRHWMETSRTADRLTSRFIAGHSIDQEIQAIERLRREKILATIDYLGENVKSREEAAGTRDTYIDILQRVSALRAGATISIKLTQFGLGLSPDIARENVMPLIERAKQLDTGVEFDMESSEFTDATLEIVEDAHACYSNIRAVIQAYLYRSEADIERLSAQRIPVRLCKGAYKEPPSIAFQKKTEVDSNYVRLVHKLLEWGTIPAMATHDEKMVAATLSAVRERKVTKDCFEFQMLYGIRRDLQQRIVAEGYRLRLYVPYGDAWYPYFMRRLAERPANVMFLAKNLLRR